MSFLHIVYLVTQYEHLLISFRFLFFVYIMDTFFLSFQSYGDAAIEAEDTDLVSEKSLSYVL